MPRQHAGACELCSAVKQAPETHLRAWQHSGAGLHDMRKSLNPERLMKLRRALHAATGVARLVEDGNGDRERAARIGHIHDARHAALARAARQQQVDLRAAPTAVKSYQQIHDQGDEHLCRLALRQERHGKRHGLTALFTLTGDQDWAMRLRSEPCRVLFDACRCTPKAAAGQLQGRARARLALGVAKLAEVVDAVEHRALERDGRVQVVLPAGLVHADAWRTARAAPCRTCALRGVRVVLLLILSTI